MTLSLSSNSASGAVAKARHMLEERRRFARQFAPHLFSDPARDILLELFIAHEERRDASISNCCTATGLALTTTLRWINNLETSGFVARHKARHDNRIIHVRLTEKAHGRMLAFFANRHAG